MSGVLLISGVLLGVPLLISLVVPNGANILPNVGNTPLKGLITEKTYRQVGISST